MEGNLCLFEGGGGCGVGGVLVGGQAIGGTVVVAAAWWGRVGVLLLFVGWRTIGVLLLLVGRQGVCLRWGRRDRARRGVVRLLHWRRMLMPVCCWSQTVVPLQLEAADCTLGRRCATVSGGQTSAQMTYEDSTVPERKPLWRTTSDYTDRVSSCSRSVVLSVRYLVHDEPASLYFEGSTRWTDAASEERKSTGPTFLCRLYKHITLRGYSQTVTCRSMVASGSRHNDW